ncbi:MAG TPA: hypothetical protein VLF89_10055 [Candidatus Saccharimonadales bacterium]|nr:hypothetical protein [Candidatus Saccharimonadales bacterium]
MKKPHFFLALLVLILIFYWRSFVLYFQGDEWYYFIQTLPYTNTWFGPLIILYKSVADSYTISAGAHLTPITNLLFFLSVQSFSFTYWLYALSGLILHMLDTILVYVFAKKIVRNNEKVAVISAIFFACSFVHQQAITWAMTYIYNGLSLAFLLLCLIHFFKAFEEKEIQKRNLIYSAIFMFCGLLTKESTAILFVIIPILTILKIKKTKFISIIKYYLPVVIIYLPYRFLLPKIFLLVSGTTNNSASFHLLSWDILLFRAVTYPLKMVTEVFIPGPWILGFVESITTLAYPQYTAEKAIGGINYLTFTQTAGSDTIIYSLAAIIIVVSIVAYIHSRRETRITILFSFLIIILSSLVLIPIAFVIPSWGYVTYIDSRHIHQASVGGVLLLALASITFSQWASKKVSRLIPISEKAILILFVVSWIILNYITLQKELTAEAITGYQRRTVIDKITQTVPLTQNKKIVYINSNFGYYGFPPIPPFQTNLGQILTIIYYQKKQLSLAFITSNYLTKGGIAGEGYKQIGMKGFGYYLDERHLMDQILAHKIDPSDVYAFAWDGNKNQITEVTDLIRKKAYDRLGTLQEMNKWKSYKDAKYGFSFRFPPDMVIKQDLDQGPDSPVIRTVTIADPDNDTQIHVILYKKIDNMGVSTFASGLSNTEDIPIEEHFTFRIVTQFNSDVQTAVYVTNSKYPMYFLGYKTNDKTLEIYATGPGFERKMNEDGTEDYNSVIEKVIQTMAYL